MIYKKKKNNFSADEPGEYARVFFYENHTRGGRSAERLELAARVAECRGKEEGDPAGFPGGILPGTGVGAVRRAAVQPHGFRPGRYD